MTKKIAEKIGLQVSAIIVFFCRNISKFGYLLNAYINFDAPLLVTYLVQWTFAIFK